MILLLTNFRVRGTRQYDNPPTKEIEEILRRRLVDDQAREYIFFTCEARDPAAFEIFVELLASPPDNAPKDHPRRKAQVRFEANTVPLIALLIHDWPGCLYFNPLPLALDPVEILQRIHPCRWSMGKH